ncbi:hypothetical protein Tco_0960578 [Tanacetum coccineum]
MMTDKYCPRNEIKKLEMEIWDLKVKGTDLKVYTQHFSEWLCCAGEDVSGKGLIKLKICRWPSNCDHGRQRVKGEVGGHSGKKHSEPSTTIINNRKSGRTLEGLYAGMVESDTIWGNLNHLCSNELSPATIHVAPDATVQESRKLLSMSVEFMDIL